MTAKQAQRLMKMFITILLLFFQVAYLAHYFSFEDTVTVYLFTIAVYSLGD